MCICIDTFMNVKFFGIYIQLWSLLHKQEGLAMIDDGPRDGKRRYWFPCGTLSSDSTGADAKS